MVRLVRRKPNGPGEIFWDPAAGILSSDELVGEAVVHLAGENIADGRWTRAKKQRIRDSRVKGTRLLCERLAERAVKPEVLVSASAIGFYIDGAVTDLDEYAPSGEDFLSEVCEEWEAATAPATEAGIRTVLLRIGVVLSCQGGALAKMLRPFQLGLAGRIGPGTQAMSWITNDDLARIILYAIEDRTIVGPVNAVAPNPVTNAEFTRSLGRALRRPTVLPMPAFAARLAFGQMADELLLASLRVVPGVLERRGFEFRHPEIQGALRHVLAQC